MKKRAASAPGGSASPTVPVRPTPHRPVVSLALALFLPALWLVLNGNLSVQTALVRFVGALVVSWVAAWLVFATTTAHQRAGSSPPRQGVAATPSSADPAGTTHPVVADATELPDDTSSAAAT